jgi:hypothetical protein
MRWAYLTFLIPLCTPIPALADGHDYPPLGHIQGYKMHNYDERRFDKVDLEADPGQKITVEGHTISIDYFAEDNSNHESDLEIYMNYLTLFKSLKAEMLHSPANMNDGNEHLLARFYRNGAAVYVNINAQDGGEVYKLMVVEQQAFKPSIVIHRTSEATYFPPRLLRFARNDTKIHIQEQRDRRCEERSDEAIWVKPALAAR